VNARFSQGNKKKRNGNLVHHDAIGISAKLFRDAIWGYTVEEKRLLYKREGRSGIKKKGGEGIKTYFKINRREKRMEREVV